jgi:hypothetical protein
VIEEEQQDQGRERGEQRSGVVVEEEKTKRFGDQYCHFGPNPGTHVGILRRADCHD